MGFSMRFSLSSSSRRRGFTLTEIAIVLGVVGVVLAGIWSASTAVQRSARVNRTIQQLTQIVSGTRALFASYGTINQSDAATFSALLYRSGIIPPELNTSTGGGVTLYHAWGGSMVVSFTAPSKLQIELYNLPLNACLDLAGKMAGSSHDPSLKEIGSTIMPVNIVSFPPSANSLLGVCAGNDPSANVGVYFVYSLK